MRRKYFLRIFLIFLPVLFLSEYTFSQVSAGGQPPSFLSGNYTVPGKSFTVAAPDLALVGRQDSLAAAKDHPYRVAVLLPLGIDLLKSGSWAEGTDGSGICRLLLTSKGASALSIYYGHFYLPPGGLLYLYDPGRKHLLGAYTQSNNSVNGLFATEMIPGDSVILEYYEPAEFRGKSVVRISDLAYVYRGVDVFLPGHEKDFGGAGNCEVNINCTEGLDWQDQKRGVVRIYVRFGGGSYWCSGSLLNNTKQDRAPLILTADHCGQNADSDDLNQWIFYFNYESETCQDPQSEPAAQTLVGAQKLASTPWIGSISKSDFYLVRLNNSIPADCNAFYNGWTRSGTASPSGVGIHHPVGDIKKISTYNTAIISSSWGNEPGTHWEVKWSQTSHGHGVTEPGSSGSPLFDEAGLVTGQLSGGTSSCANLDEPDYYGKISYSWNPAGSTDSTSLHRWLDPEGLGNISLAGSYGDSNIVIAAFQADTTIIPVGGSIGFRNISTGHFTSLRWTFEGGTPGSSSADSEKVVYQHVGHFSVSLQAKNEVTSNTAFKGAYIKVIPRTYPNPARGALTVDFGDQPAENLEIGLFDLLGRKVPFSLFRDPQTTQSWHYLVTPGASRQGIFLLKISNSSGTTVSKVIWLK